MNGLTREDGATAVEYALLASAIAAAIMAVVFAVGVGVADWFSRVQSF